MKIILIILCVLLLLFIGFAWWLPSFVMTGKRQTLDEAFKWQSEQFDTSFYEKLEKTDYIVKGFEGYDLHVEYLKNPEPTDRYVIITHGYTDNHIGSLKYVPIYLELGFNCIIYDLRGHGENEPTFTTYGIKEGNDLLCVIEDTRERYKDISLLGLHGESLGSATTITCLKYKPEVDFAVADCGFSDIENVLRAGYDSAHLPSFTFDLADLMAKLRYHYSLKEMRPIDSLDDNTVPILFIHGDADELISPENSKRMSQRTKGYSEVKLIPGAGHAVSVFTEPELYKQYVEEFLEKQFKEEFGD
ncbi:MAG: prolyl oligopeptidase family serine peptidase [Erysipelotrichaceae bacterium]|nr:prolyl oligopeptidase family serine peptidase [Erysipelotrichaceae bacterium]